MAVVPIVITPSMAENFRNNIQAFADLYSSLCEQYPIIRLIVSLCFLAFAVELVPICFKSLSYFFSKE